MKKFTILVLAAVCCGCTTVQRQKAPAPVQAPLGIVAISVEGDKAILQVAGAENVCPDFVQCSGSLAGEWKDAEPKFRGFRQTEAGTVVLMEVDATANSQFYRTIDRGQAPVAQEMQAQAKAATQPRRILTKRTIGAKMQDPPSPLDAKYANVAKSRKARTDVVSDEVPAKPEEKEEKFLPMCQLGEPAVTEKPEAVVTIRDVVLQQPTGDLPEDPVAKKEE